MPVTAETFWLAFRALDELAAARAQIVALTQQQSWQPTETAPKDTELLLWSVDDDGFGCAVLGKYIDFDGRAPEGYHDGWFDSFTGELELTPTHWMPLPAPPAVPAGEEHV